MFLNCKGRLVTTMVLTTVCLTACFRPPFNNFQKRHQEFERTATGAAIGTGFGAVAGTIAGGPLVGLAIGGVTGSMLASWGNSRQRLVAALGKDDIEYIAYGDTQELLVPTDKYFEFNRHRLNDRCYRGLNNIARFLEMYSCNPIYVAAFTDEIGTRYQKNKMSQARADAMITFLWAKGIRAQHLYAEGMGDKYPIGDNFLTHGSAFNRRIEIQWVNQKLCHQKPKIEMLGVSK